MPAHVARTSKPAAVPAAAGDSPAGAAATRVVSIDALRGFDMFWIIGASTVVQQSAKASGHPWLAWLAMQMEHVEWDGFHFIDLIFPLFLFLIGTAIPYSLSKRLARGDSLAAVYGHVLFRVAVLVVLGMMVNGSLLTYDPSQFELTYSVLQMLALGYLVAAALFLTLRLPGQILATAAMLVGYWALLAFVPGPGHQVGKFAPGCNLGDWVTQWLVGPWRGHQIGWILGILGHASTAMLGVFAGQLLRSALSGPRKAAWLAVWGVFSLAAGLFWSGWFAQHWPGVTLGGVEWNEWPVWFPIIKNRWTSSYVLYAGGWSLLLLALFYLVIDVWKLRRWAQPLVVIGANSIFAYMAWQLGSSVLREAAAILLGGLEQYISPEWYAPLLTVGAMGVLWLLLWYLYRNKTFIRA
jgi:predicted acyltransferase